MASLKLLSLLKTIQLLKESFDEQGTKVYVNSEYVRLHEEVKVPYLVNSKTDFSKTMTGKFADEIRTTAKKTSMYTIMTLYAYTNLKPTNM